MEISYKGGTSLVIATKKTTLLVDPKVSQLGLKDPSVTDAVEIATEEQYVVRSPRLLMDGPGEYEVGDFSIRGVAARSALDTLDVPPRSTMYRVETSEYRIAILGHIQNKLSDEQLEALGVVDILILPVGGNGYSLDPHDAAAFARLIDPKVVMPMHYDDPALKYEVPQLPLSEFVKELGVPVETVDKFKLKNQAGLPENLTIVELTRS